MSQATDKKLLDGVMDRIRPIRDARQRQVDTAQAEADAKAAEERHRWEAEERQRREEWERDRPQREARQRAQQERKRKLAEERAKARAKAAHEHALADTLKSFGRASFPQRHRVALESITLSDEQDKARDTICTKILDGAMVVLAGDRGCGKTQVATNAAWQLTGEAGSTFRYWTLAGMIAAYHDAAFGPNRAGGSWIADNAGVTMLVIDELGERRDTAEVQHILTQVLDYRYRYMLGTLLITNTQPSKLEHDLSASAMSRLMEGGGVIDASSWPNRRARPNGDE